jgi:hypothetical protein
MANNKGINVTLYLLITSDSALRRELEGKYPKPPTIPNPPPPPGPAQDTAELYRRFVLHVVGDGTAAHPGLGLANGDLPVNIRMLFDPHGAGNVATYIPTILSAMDGPYDPDAGPCPDLPDEYKIMSRLKGQI